MKTKLSLLFYLKKPRNYQTGPVPIYLGITIESGLTGGDNSGRSQKWYLELSSDLMSCR